MTTYTCKRGDCSVLIVHSLRRGIADVVTLNGQVVTAPELGSKLGLSRDSIHRRLKGKRCLQIAHDVGNRKQKAQTPADARSDSDRLAAKFNQLPRASA